MQTSLRALMISSAPSVWPYVVGGLVGFVASVLSIVGYEWLRRPIIELGVGDAMPRAAGRGCLTLAASPGGWPDSARAFRPMVTTVGRLAVLPRHGGPAPPIQPSVAEAIVLLSRPRPLEVVPGHDE